jgi:response regulator RpfG family c-di-GMP phosphodiesterase
MANRNLILYVDNILDLKMFEVKFGDKFHLLTADTGEKGLEMLENFKDIRIVIADMKMTGMNGLEFTRKAFEKYPEIDYFLLTGYEISKRVQHAVETGMVRKCFTKPFNLNEISHKIEEVLSK